MSEIKFSDHKHPQEELMSKAKRIDIEKAENGYTIRVHKDEEGDEKTDNYGYKEPEIMVATSEEELMKVIKEIL